MALLFLLVLLPASSSLKTQSAALQLSPTLNVSWPRELKLEVLSVPTQNGFWLEKKGATDTIWIGHQTPEQFGTLPTVTRFWKRNLEMTEELGENTKDLGCRSLKTSVFQCERTATTSQKQFVAETFFWRAKSDLIHVRVSSKESLATAQAMLKSFHVDAKDGYSP